MKKIILSFLALLGFATLGTGLTLTAASDVVVSQNVSYAKVKSQAEITEGEYLIAAVGTEIFATAMSSSNFYQSGQVADATVFEFINAETGFILKNAGNGKFIDSTAKNKISEVASSTLCWIATYNESGTQLVSQGTPSRALQYNAGSPRFSAYDAKGMKNLDLYKKITSDVKFTVSFETNGGGEIAAQEVMENGLVIAPEIPTKSGFIFAGWYKETNLENEWNFSSDKVTSAITLYAKWGVERTVTFETNGGTAVNSITVADGAKLIAPQTQLDGMVLEGWYKDITLTEAWNFDTDVVTSNITLYAKFVNDPYQEVVTTSEVVSAQYVISSYTSLKYLSGTLTNKQFDSTNDRENAAVVTVIKYTDYYTLEIDGKYLGVSGSDLINSTTVTDACKWDIKEEENKGFYFVNRSVSSRALLYRSSNTGDVYKAYAKTNINTAGYELTRMYKVKGSEIAQAPLDFVVSETKSSLKVAYDADLKATDVDLRFGGIISAGAYVEGATYGVMVTASDVLPFTAGKTEFASAEAFLTANANVKNLVCEPALLENGSYQFAWVINNMEGHYNDTLTAVMYMEYEGVLYFCEAVSQSVVQAANYYFDNGEALGLTEEQLEVMLNIVSDYSI